MKNLFSGLIVFIIQIGLMFVITFAHVNIANWLYSTLFGLMVVLYFYFGYKTSNKESHRLAGIVFYFLALITIIFILRLNSGLSG